LEFELHPLASSPYTFILKHTRINNKHKLKEYKLKKDGIPLQTSIASEKLTMGPNTKGA
jgi:hypothetical protein